MKVKYIVSISDFLSPSPLQELARAQGWPDKTCWHALTVPQKGAAIGNGWAIPIATAIIKASSFKLRVPINSVLSLSLSLS